MAGRGCPGRSTETESETPQGRPTSGILPTLSEAQKGVAMSDEQLTQLLINLAEAIRDVPEGQVQQMLADRFFAVVGHLESRHLIRQDQWEPFNLR